MVIFKCYFSGELIGLVAINIDEHYTNNEKSKYYNHKNVLNFLYSSNCQKELLQALFYP